MRITQRAVALTSLQGLNRNLDAVGKLQQQLTSGRLINAPSDSPTGTNRAMQTRGEQAAVAQQARNISDAKGWLEQTDSTLQTMLDTARKVRDLTVQGLSTGSSVGRQPAGAGHRGRLAAGGPAHLANTTIQGRPLFGGVTPGAKAYDATGAWVGLAGPPVTRRVSDTEKVRVDITGPEAFGPRRRPVRRRRRIAGRPDRRPGGARRPPRRPRRDHEGHVHGVADVGARAKRLERSAQINADRSLTLQSQLAETENIDLPNTIMRLQMQKVGYEARWRRRRRRSQPTLLDYLR